MSHFLNVPTNENGIIADLNLNLNLNLDVDVQTASRPPSAFTDVFVYSHGWWTSDNDASANHNRFSIGFAKTLQTLAGQVPPPLALFGQGFSGLTAAFYWPSVLSEDPGSVLNLLEATSFFTMQGRADAIGSNGAYALLRLLIEARHGQPPLRFHLVGHSFGCRVGLSALQKMASDAATVGPCVGNVHQAAGRLAVADLTPLHAAQYQAEMGGHMPTGGQRSDILLPEIYELVARFATN